MEEYKDVLERLNASITFKSIDRDQRDTARLVETGAKKLTQLYTKLVAEGSSGVPLNGAEFEFNPFPNSLKTTLVPLVNFLRTLPLPPTHPSHPAAPAIQQTLKEAQKGYADMRGSWSKKCLENFGRRVVDRAETIDGIAAGRELGQWVNDLLRVADVSFPHPLHYTLGKANSNLLQAEYELLLELAPIPTSTSVEQTFGTLISPLLTIFTSNLSSLSALIKRSLHKYTFLALSVFANLSAVQGDWDDIMCRRAGKRENELKEGLHALRASVLRSFPEFIADVRAASLGKGGELSTGLADITLSVSIK